MPVPLPKILEVTAIANSAMREHNLIAQGWKFKLDNSKRRVGACRHGKKEIGLSMWYIEQTPIAKLKDTILHEIAHALVGPDNGHNETWKAMCLRIGAEPTRLAGEEKVSAATHNFEIRCETCNLVWKRYRLKRSLHGAKCGACGTPLTFYKINRKDSMNGS